MRLIDKIAEEKFDGDIYKAIEFVYEEFAHESNPTMDRIYKEFTDEERKIAAEVIKKRVVKKAGKNAVDDLYDSINMMEKIQMTDEEILSSDKNPFAVKVLIYVVLLLCVIALPLLLMYFTKNSGISLFGIELKRILSVLPVILITPVAMKLGPAINDFFTFKRLKKYLTAVENNEKASLQSFRVSWIACIFMGIAVIMSFAAVEDLNILKDYKENGVKVEATSYDVEWYNNHEDFEVYYSYEYQEKEYSHQIRNYHGGHKIGKTIEAYIYPESPDKLYVPEGNLFVIFFMFMLAVLFSWVENSMRKNHLTGGFLIEGLLMTLAGIYYGLKSWLIAGVVISIAMLIIILFRNFKKTS